MSKPKECRRYGCTTDGHPALDGYCSVECRDVQEARDEAATLRALLTRVLAHDDSLRYSYPAIPGDLRRDIEAALGMDKPKEEAR